MRFLLLLAALAVAGCASSPDGGARRSPDDAPATYVVVKGDALYAIAWRYGLDYREVARWNQLRSPDRIYPGQRLRLRPPDGGVTVAPAAATLPLELQSTPSPKAPAKPQAAATAAPAPTRSSPAPAATPRGWLWPTAGKVVRDFRADTPGRKGIDIEGSIGQAILATAGGTVVYSGSGLPGYGRLIIVKHSDTHLSAYGYLGKIKVNEGDSVSAGQQIAEMGVGFENRPVLHFEVRRNGKPIDPMTVLKG